jgi:hypothetical protein
MGHISMTVSPVSINPGEEAHWNLLIAFHKGGPEEGKMIYQDNAHLQTSR